MDPFGVCDACETNGGALWWHSPRFRSLRNLFGSGAYKVMDCNKVTGVYEMYLRRCSDSGSPGLWDAPFYQTLHFCCLYCTLAPTLIWPFILFFLSHFNEGMYVFWEKKLSTVNLMKTCNQILFARIQRHPRFVWQWMESSNFFTQLSSKEL